MIFRRSTLRRLGGAVLLAGLLSCSLMGITHAQYTVCRTDPIATLSNGHTITMYADINDSAKDIQSAEFTLHVPKNMTVKSVTFDSTYGYLESFSWVADQNPGNYHTDTLVTTKTSGINVVGNAGSSMSTCQLSNKSTQGQDGKSIHINFNC